MTDHPGGTDGKNGKSCPLRDQGLRLFRDGHRAEALPLLARAADQGEPQAQYLVGVALFNGDHVAPDLGRATKLLRAAAAAGIAQARAALDEIGERAALPARNYLLSRRTAQAVERQFARIDRSRAAPDTLHALMLDILSPLLRERLDVAVPVAVRKAVDRTLTDLMRPDQPSPVKS